MLGNGRSLGRRMKDQGRENCHPEIRTPQNRIAIKSLKLPSDSLQVEVAFVPAALELLAWSEAREMVERDDLPAWRSKIVLCC